MSRLRNGLVVGASVCTALMLTAVGASATSGGSRFEATLVSALTAGHVDLSGGTSSGGNAFGQAISSLARSIPPGPMHGKLVSSYARHMNPSNFNGSHSKSGQNHGHNGGSNHSGGNPSGSNKGQGASSNNPGSGHH